MEALARVMLAMLALPMLLAYPLSELARGMASNPGAHRRSCPAALLSLFGFTVMALAVVA